MAYVCSKSVIAIIILYPQELYEVHPYKEGVYHIIMGYNVVIIYHVSTTENHKLGSQHQDGREPTTAFCLDMIFG